MNVGERSTLARVLFCNKYYLRLSQEGFSYRLNICTRTWSASLSNIPQAFCWLALPFTHFLHRPHTCSSFQFSSLALLPHCLSASLVTLDPDHAQARYFLLHILHANVLANANPAQQICLPPHRDHICFVLHLS